MSRLHMSQYGSHYLVNVFLNSESTPRNLPQLEAEQLREDTIVCGVASQYGSRPNTYGIACRFDSVEPPSSGGELY
jgi:hypothetical protein